MISSAFSRNLRKYRKQRGLTQAALGHLCGYVQGHISNLERGAIAPSMAVLKKLASALGLSPAELLMEEADERGDHIPGVGIAILNERKRDRLAGPGTSKGRVVSDSRKVLCLPGVRSQDAFAAFLPDDAMAPAFGKGDLVVFSLTQEPADGDVCLVDTGKGEVVFRTALALPSGQWRLQPTDPKFQPVVIKARQRVRMWPAIGRWEWLAYRRRR